MAWLPFAMGNARVQGRGVLFGRRKMQLSRLALALVVPFTVLDGKVQPDYAIYSVVLDRTIEKSSADPLIVVMDSTASRGLVTAGLKTELMRRHFGVFAATYETTLDDFVAKNQASIGVAEKPFASFVKVIVVARKDLPSSDTIDPRNPREFWNQFHAKYPGARGIITFSRPGFDKSGNHALVYYRLSCGTLCGQVGYVLLKNSGGQWRVLQEVVPIIS
jgi:hypothetical protein